MKYIKVVNGKHPNNTYLLYDNWNNCLIIDPSLESNVIDSVIIKNCFNVQGVLITHAHYDHIYSVDFFTNKYHCNVYCSKQAVEYLSNSSLNLSKTSKNSIGEVCLTSIPAVVENTLSIGNFKFKVLDTSGHSKTCITYLIDDLAFTGDFVFKGKIGRCDLFDSSLEKMYKSIHKFMDIKKDFKILPGHGEETTLELEKQFNPHFIKVRNLYE